MAEGGAFLEQFKDGERSELSELRFAVVTGRFYEDLANRLMEGADAGLELAGVPIGNVTHFSVPGAYELPFAAKQLVATGILRAIVRPAHPASSARCGYRPAIATSPSTSTTGRAD